MKAEIDKFISLNYDKLLEITKKKVAYFKRDVCPYAMLSDAYLYVCRNHPPTKEKIPHYIVNWINIELKYPKSNTNRKKVLDRCVELWDWNTFDERPSIESVLDFDMCMEDFVNGLNKIDQIVWEVMTVKGYTKIRELSEHFEIPESTINLYRMRLLDEFRGRKYLFADLSSAQVKQFVAAGYIDEALTEKTRKKKDNGGEVQDTVDEQDNGES